MMNGKFMSTLLLAVILSAGVASAATPAETKTDETGSSLFQMNEVNANGQAVDKVAESSCAAGACGKGKMDKKDHKDDKKNADHHCAGKKDKKDHKDGDKNADHHCASKKGEEEHKDH